MLERVEHDSGIVTFQSPLLRDLGVRHGFSTRPGGVSAPPYDTLNLGSLAKGPDGDANTSVAENFRRLRRALDMQRLMRLEVRQVHGGDVHVADQPVRPCHAPCADAVVTQGPQRFAMVRVADCVPVLLATLDGGRVAAVHAGWRGVVANVIGNALRTLGEPVIAAIGPCISAAHFEVGEEVAAAFDAAGLAAAVHRSPGQRPHIDLREAVHQQLADAGVPTDRIDTTDACTYTDDRLFFSHRRDVTHAGKPATGRLAALIAPSVA